MSERTRQWKLLSRALNAEFRGGTIRQCWMLNGSQFAVTPDALKVCTSATHESGSPTICSIQAAKLGADEFLQGIARIIRANQEADGPCVGCRYLVETVMPKKFVARRITTVSLHDFCGCNSSCVYCGGSEYELPIKYEATVDHVELFRDLLSDGMIRPGMSRVFWGGGEPTLLKTFDATVDLLSSHRIRQTINTSGVRFSEATLSALSRRTASVVVSVDSGTDDGFRRVKRNPHVAEVWDSIRRYAATGADLTVKYIILSLNSDPTEVGSFIERCGLVGVRRIRISVDARSVYGIDHDIAPITEKELQAAATMRALALERGIEVAFEQIWTDEQLARIGLIGGFDANCGQGVSERLRRLSSIEDAREFAGLALGALRRRL